MKNKSLIRFLIAGFLLLANQTKAQLVPAIDSLKLIPNNPTSNDVLKVVCHTVFPYGGCNFTSAHAEQQGNNIFLSIDYNMGMITYICDRKDTIQIDNPGAGDFQLLVSITTNEEASVHDTDTLEFHIDPFLGIPQLNSGSFEIFPNPFNQELTFKASFPVKKMAIHSPAGQQVYFNESFENQLIDLSHLEQGVYFITLIDKNENKFTQRVIKNTP